MLRLTTAYDDARGQIRNGDILLLNRPGLIPWGTLGGASHVMIAKWVDDAVLTCDESHCEQTLEIVEAREGNDIRAVTLHSQIKKFPGLIDVYRPLCPLYVAEKAATIAMRQTGKRYDYFGLLRAALLRTPLAHWAFNYRPLDPDDLPQWDDDKFCSFLADWIFCRALYELGETDNPWRLVPNVNPRDVVPVNIEQSGSARRIIRGLVP